MFAIVCFLSAAYTFLRSDMKYQVIDDFLFLKKIEYILLFCIPPAFMKFISSYFGRKKELVLNIFYIASLAGIPIVLFTNEPSIWDNINQYYTQLTWLFGLIVLLRLFIREIRYSIDARLFLLGTLVCLAGIINDIMVNRAIIIGASIGSFTFIFFVFLAGIILANNYVKMVRKIEELNENLEKKINERTNELNQSNLRMKQEIKIRQEIEDQMNDIIVNLESKTLEVQNLNNILKVRNEIMENDMEIARKIQQQLIPIACPSTNLCAIYKPMDKVGGDFYDFLNFRHSNEIGIFLSDVSGHGVPAAFITSMIKTLLLQAGSVRQNPADLLLYLNDMLLNQTVDYYITAFYGIYNPETRNFLFANAGHNAPYTITNGRVEKLHMPVKCPPLSLLSRRDLEKYQKTYFNRELILGVNSKLVMYTDGLSEAVNIHDPTRQFGEFELEKVLQEDARHISSEFIDLIYNKLIKFRGSENFDDDICIICLNTDR